MTPKKLVDSAAPSAYTPKNLGDKRSFYGASKN
jgi:hypothetical protein